MSHDLSRFSCTNNAYVYWAVWFYLRIKTFTNLKGQYVFVYVVTIGIQVDFKFCKNNNRHLFLLNNRHIFTSTSAFTSIVSMLCLLNHSNETTKFEFEQFLNASNLNYLSYNNVRNSCEFC